MALIILVYSEYKGLWISINIVKILGLKSTIGRTSRGAANALNSNFIRYAARMMISSWFKISDENMFLRLGQM